MDNNKSYRNRLLLFSILILLFGVITNCQESFNPLQENYAAPFSIYGYLDASADTQWVRIEPIRNQLDTSFENSSILVTLEDVESQTTTVMKDSLFTVNEGNAAINVWTTMDIQPSHTYRIRAERPDGAFSHVTVTTPADFPTPAISILGDPPYTRGTLLLKDIDNVVDIVTVWKVYGKIYRVPYRDRIENSAPVGFDSIVNLSAYRDVNIIFDQNLNPTSAGIIADKNVHRQIFIASGGPQWENEISSLSDLEYSIPEAISNVENGVGYVIGIVSKTIPFKPCLDDEMKPIACLEEKPF